MRKTDQKLTPEQYEIIHQALLHEAHRQFPEWGQAATDFPEMVVKSCRQHDLGQIMQGCEKREALLNLQMIDDLLQTLATPED